MARYLAQVVVLGAQVVARAFARAVQQEYTASNVAAKAASGRSGSRAQAMSNVKHGLTSQEAREILNVDKIDAEKIEMAFKHLFEANDKSKGGSFYIQSKVVRAKERLDEELRTTSETIKKNQNTSS